MGQHWQVEVVGLATQAHPVKVWVLTVAAVVCLGQDAQGCEAKQHLGERQLQQLHLAVQWEEV